MSKFEIRSPLLITAALALAPAVAFAAGDSNPSKTTTTTTTTTSAPPMTNPPAASGSLDRPSGSEVLSPTTPPEMTAKQAQTKQNANANQASIDPAQVQRVFGMDVALIDLKSLNQEQVKQLQQRLQERGFYHGQVDGMMGPQTRNALTGLLAQQYALNQRLVNQGQITQQLASSIGVDTQGRAMVNGMDTGAQQQPAQRGNSPSNNAPQGNSPSNPPQGNSPSSPPNQ